MDTRSALGKPGVLPALTAALLFGTGTPLAKLLLQDVSPWMMAGLLYAGSGIGLWLYRRLVDAPAVRLPRSELLWLAAAVFAGGICGPVLLMFGLTRMPASGASLLLNAEGAFTAMLAWFIFRENFDRRIALGMLAVLAGAAILSWPTDIEFAGLWPACAVLGACFAWGIDNNLTRKISLVDATWIATVKGLTAGLVNLGIALLLGDHFPSLGHLGGAMLLGFAAYGISLALFVVSLRHLGSARTGAYFSVAPFFGATLALCLGDPLTWPLVLAAALMAIGVWLHLTEHHVHEHVHEPIEHEHEHEHDEHHQHEHDDAVAAKGPHRHRHRHHPMKHQHVHFPDAHHRHGH
ncbi:MAG: DMT family transporter [Gammaproteobacteria bacterium]|nr:DMT family transporter [Gammaproteobacteria bacterium]